MKIMMLEKEKIRRIIRDHKITSFHETDEKELVDIFYETLVELGHTQEEKLATKEDIKMVLEMMDKRFEDMNKKFTMMFTFMNIGFGLLVLLTVLFKFLS